MRLCLVGFGSVGQGVAEALLLKISFWKKRYGLNVKVVAVADSSGAALNQNGLNLEKLLKIKQKDRESIKLS